MAGLILEEARLVDAFRVGVERGDTGVQGRISSHLYGYHTTTLPRYPLHPMPVSHPAAGVSTPPEEENSAVAMEPEPVEPEEPEPELPPLFSIFTLGQQKREASQILPNLFLSNAMTARWGGTLDQLKITHIISVLEEPITFPRTEQPLKLLHIPASDDSTTDLLAYMDQTTEFIKEAIGTDKRDQPQFDPASINTTAETIDGESPILSGPAQENRVLVHCFAGMSRSAAIVIAYLLATTPMTAREATEFVRSKRKIIRPNYGFTKQLEQYERRYFVSTGKSAAPKKTVGTDIASRIQLYRDVVAGVRKSEE